MRRLLASKVVYKLYIVIIFVLLSGTLVMQREKFLGNEIWEQTTAVEQTAKFTNDDIKKIFADATSCRIRNDSIIVFRKQEGIGWAYNSSPSSNDIIGYVSSVPILIGFDNENKLVGLTLLKNYESPDFVQKIVESDFLSSWNNLSLDELSSEKVDAFSGATLTSSAIIKTVKKSAGILSNQKVNLSVSSSPVDIIKIVLGYLLVLLALVQFFFPKKTKRFRTVFQILVIVILGFWSGTFLSIFSFENWLFYGIDLPAKLFVFVILLLSIILPLFTNKAFYCSHLCPFGASQELMGKLCKKKIKLAPKTKEFLSTLREKIFATIMLLLFIGVSFDLTNIEPFSAFLFNSAALPVIILAIVFLLLSIFIPKPWCRYACPTGFLLETIRKSPKK